MKITFKTKLLIGLFMSILALLIFNINVYATDTTSFAFEKEIIDVGLNGTKWISYAGGTGVITWESSDESVATVENGIVTGHKIGTATITATRGEESDSCTVNVVYNSIIIGDQFDTNISALNLILNEHSTDTLIATVEDGKYEKVENASVTWSSSDTSIVTVDKNGTLKALKAGTATITASATGVTDTCEVAVYNSPVFTDFSNAKYELLFDTNVDLKITGVTPKEEGFYHYIITSNNTKPILSFTSYGTLDTEVVTEANYLNINTEENYIFARNLDKYVELNQDLYLWVVEGIKLEAAYKSGESNYISYSSKYVVEGVKLTRPQLPQLNLILKSFTIWGGENSANTEEYSSIYFRFPTAVENRNFKIKIGKVTDNTILQKIQKNDYSGITSLLTYAKNNNALYTADLTTTHEGYFSTDKALFDGLSLLQHKAYYFIYVEFDDENGKYYPIEGVTLGQAWVSDSNKYWDLMAYTSEKFQWNNLSSTPTEPEQKEEPDNTVAVDKLPNAGSKTFVIISVIVLVACICIICYKKYNWFRDIK